LAEERPVGEAGIDTFVAQLRQRASTPRAVVALRQGDREQHAYESQQQSQSQRSTTVPSNDPVSTQRRSSAGGDRARSLVGLKVIHQLWQMGDYPPDGSAEDARSTQPRSSSGPCQSSPQSHSPAGPRG